MTFARAALAAIVAVTPAVSHAATSSFSDLGTFQAAAGPTLLEDFESFVSDISFVGAPLNVGDFTISYNGTVSGIFNLLDTSGTNINNGTGTNVIIGGVLAGELITFTFANAITAFAADFFALNDGVARSEFDVAGETFALPVQSGQQPLFFGVVSDTPFTTFVVRGLAPNEGFGVDNIRYGTGVIPAIPLPATLPLAVGGLVLLMGLVRPRADQGAASRG